MPIDDFKDHEEAVRTWLIALDGVDGAADVKISAAAHACVDVLCLGAVRQLHHMGILV